AVDSIKRVQASRTSIPASPTFASAQVWESSAATGDVTSVTALSAAMIVIAIRNMLNLLALGERRPRSFEFGGRYSFDRDPICFALTSFPHRYLWRNAPALHGYPARVGATGVSLRVTLHSPHERWRALISIAHAGLRSSCLSTFPHRKRPPKGG